MTGLSSAGWLTRVVLATALITASAGTSSAQTHDFTTERVTLATTERASLAAAASNELRRLDRQQPVRIERRRNDSVLNGALIGAAAGVASGLLLCRAMEPWEVCNDPGPLVRTGALGAAIGIGVDLLIREKEVVYGREHAPQLQVAPIAGRRAKGVQVGFAF